MPDRLIERLREFSRERFPQYREKYRRLVAEGQKPATLFIGCSDSRVVPDLLLGSEPGEVFIVRNVGNFVPPFESDEGLHGTSAGIEFATVMLEVKDIVVCGHSDCGAIRALYSRPNAGTPHINAWLKLGLEARLEGPVTDELLRKTEQRSVVLQLERLMTFPMVRERVEAGALSLHGWHFDLTAGVVSVLDVEAGRFVAAS